MFTESKVLEVAVMDILLVIAGNKGRIVSV